MYGTATEEKKKEFNELIAKDLQNIKDDPEQYDWGNIFGSMFGSLF